VIGFQSFRGFPRISPELERRFLRLVDEHGWALACLDGNVDVAVRSDRLLDEDEIVDYLRAQLETAGRLGFPVLRLQNMATPAVMERLLPTAERLDVKLGMEIHAPETVRSPWVLALRELYDRLDSPYLGFIPDFGASTRAISPSVFDAFRAKGVSDELLDAIAARWDELGERQFEAHEEIGNFIGLAHQYGAGDHAVNLAVFAVGIHGHQDPHAWREILPRVVHVHAKFFRSPTTARSRSSRWTSYSACWSTAATRATSRASTRAGTGTPAPTRSSRSRGTTRSAGACSIVSLHEPPCHFVHGPVGRLAAGRARRKMRRVGLRRARAGVLG
jgi:hypothetical protein